MLVAIIILSLLSLLIATEVDHTALPGGPVPGKSLRPKARERSEQKEEKPDQLAA